MNRRRLAAAVTAVLAVTAGTALTATPATATPAAPANAVRAGAQEQGQAAEATVTLPANARLGSAGNTGFMTHSLTPTGTTFQWTSYADGSTKELAAPATDYYGSDMSDIVFSRKWSQSTYWINDMANPSNMLYGLSPGDQRYQPYGMIGSRLVMGYVNDQGVLGVVILAKNPWSSSNSEIRVTDIPGNARLVRVSGTTQGLALVTYRIDAQHYLATLDLATGKVIERREASAGQPVAAAFLSPSHLAWIERPTDTTAQLVTVPRTGEQEPAVTPLGEAPGPLAVHLVGDWATYSMTGGQDAVAPSGLHPLTARSLTSPGQTVTLLDHVNSSTVNPDGTLLVRGGTVAQGEGFYRIAPGEDGVPAATLVASTGAPTALALTGHTVPPVVDLDKNGGTAQLSWTLSRSNAAATVTLRHVKTGKTTTMSAERMDVLPLNWNGQLGIDVAPNGDYVWEVTARPMNGIGPDLRKTGAFKVVRKAALHDFDDNGTPDILVRDAAGRLWKDEVRKTWSSDQYWSTGSKPAGTGWNIYNQVEAVGNVGGAPATDLVARDTSGVLWLYFGKGDGTFAPRVRLGGGWNAYNKLTGGSDLNGDGKADMLATDTSGGLWFYKGTGNWSAPFGARVRIGTGFGVYNHITATGDLGGTAAGDLLARDTSGVLWFYPGNGTGAFSARVRLGGGWNAYTHLVGMGDANRDGRNDLYAYGPGGSYVYPGTGNVSAPFGPRAQSSIHPATTRPYNPVI